MWTIYEINRHAGTIGNAAKPLNAAPVIDRSPLLRFEPRSVVTKSAKKNPSLSRGELKPTKTRKIFMVVQDQLALAVIE